MEINALSAPLVHLWDLYIFLSWAGQPGGEARSTTHIHCDEPGGVGCPAHYKNIYKSQRRTKGALKAFISMLLELVQFGVLGGDQSNYLHALRAGFMGGRAFLPKAFWYEISLLFYVRTGVSFWLNSEVKIPKTHGAKWRHFLPKIFSKSRGLRHGGWNFF